MIRLGLLLWLLGCVAAQAQPVIGSTQRSAPIIVSTATTTQLVAAPTQANQSIFVTGITMVAAGADNVQFVAGTGTNCATGQTNLTGVLTMAAGAQPVIIGGGAGVSIVVPNNNALCVTTSAAVVLGGVVAYGVY